MVLSFLQNESIALHVSGIKDLAGNVMEPALFTAPFSPVAVNYARLGVASQRDDPGWDGPAWKAIDGNTSGDNWCHTRNADNEWWEVDLKATRLIGSVRVFFRGGMNDRDANLDLVIYDKPEVEGRVELYRTHISSSEIPPNPSTLTLNPPVAGRVVRIEHPVGIAEYLCLSEVQVFPPPPRFWRTWWTVGLAVLGTTVVAGASVRLLEKRRFNRRMRVLEQQSALERERTRIAQDLHDEMGAKLCRISFLSENARRRGEVPEDLQNQIDSISSVSREVLRTLDQIVWAVNPKNDTLEHMASYIAHYAQDYFQMTGIDCEQDIPAGLPPHALSSQIRHHLFLVVQEAFSNILKHSKATRAKVSMALARDAFTIVISDNGAGFDGAATAGGPTGGGGNGLDNMRQRMHAIGGVCRVQSQPGQGTVVHVELALTPASPTH
jgi:signal transduction histidine kinase